jgi:hypothetical protein
MLQSLRIASRSATLTLVAVLLACVPFSLTAATPASRGDSDVVDLDAGEIAIRHRNDVTISVLRLKAARGDTRRNPELAARQQADASNSTTSSVVARSDSSATRPRLDTSPGTDDVAGSGVVTTPERGRVVDAIADTSATVNAKAAIDLGGNDSKAVTTTVDAGVSAVAAPSPSVRT